MRYLLTSLLLCFASILFAQKTVIHCGQLVDTKSATMLKEMTIVVEKNKIIDVQKGYATATATDKVIDLKAYTVMPGLIDGHVHMDHENNPNRMLAFTQNKADIAFTSIQYSKTTLMAGFTTVRDVGGSVSIAIRNAINKGLMVGPRVYTFGTVCMTSYPHTIIFGCSYNSSNFFFGKLSTATIFF